MVRQAHHERKVKEFMRHHTSSLLKNSTCVLRQAQHERETLIISMLFSLILRLSKDEQRVFQQTARYLHVGREVRASGG